MQHEIIDQVMGTRRNLSRCLECGGLMEKYQDTLSLYPSYETIRAIVYMVCTHCGRKTDGVKQASLAELVREERDRQSVKAAQAARPAGKGGAAQSPETPSGR